MLTAIEISNFKGIGTRQRIEFSPLTLLFGANSAGKSTIFQALLYLHELLERGNADVDRTELGGSIVELGGFGRLVHRHETDRAIVLRAEFATPGGLDRFEHQLIGNFPFPDLDDEIESAWIEMTIRLGTTTFRGPFVERAVIGVGCESEPLVEITAVPPKVGKGSICFVTVNLGHPLVVSQASDVFDGWKQIACPPVDVLRRGLEAETEGGGQSPSSAATVGGSVFGDGFSRLTFLVNSSRLSALLSIGEPLRVLQFSDDASAEDVDAAIQVQTFLEMVVLGTTGQLVSFLRDALYIGPLRAIPPRGFLYERTGRVTNWADGLAAWELLLADRGDLVERVNLWLGRLATDCRIVVQQLFDRGASAEEISDGHVDRTVRRLLLDTGAGSLVLPSEVGAGVSQIIPVIVAALDRRARLALVEQPELHVHPAVQVGLGDLFIDAVTEESARRTLLVETHSEHLILRLLRRIRETTDKELPDGSPAFTEDKLSVLYVENLPDGVRVHRISVDERGEFKDRWPKGFFAERMEELL